MWIWDREIVGHAARREVYVHIYDLDLGHESAGPRVLSAPENMHKYVPSKALEALESEALVLVARAQRHASRDAQMQGARASHPSEIRDQGRRAQLRTYLCSLITWLVSSVMNAV